MHRGSRLNFFPRLILAAAFCTATTAPAADLPPDVLAKNRWMELTRADYERTVSKLPENLRFEFSTSPKRVQGVLNNLLVTKTLPAQAKVHGVICTKTRSGSNQEGITVAVFTERQDLMVDVVIILSMAVSAIR